MAAYDLEEQEQLAELKAWWKQYGNLVTSLVLAASIGMAGWQGWNWYQRNQAAQASAVFGVLQRGALERDLQKVKTASGELLEKHAGTAYAQLGALTAAKALFDGGDLKTAKIQLAWLVDQGKDEMRDLARLRLAAVLIDEQAYDEALKQLAATPAPGFAARYAEMKGDAHAAQGKKGEARAAYADALARLDAAAKAGDAGTLQDVKANAPYREMLQQKLDAQGGAQ